MDQSHIRNFCIIAHIDHGKSTLADRLLEMTGTVEKRDMQEQLLDSNPIERERGITIKLAPVRMVYRPAEIPNSKYQIPNKFKNQNDPNNLEIRNLDLKIANSKQEFVLNLIDTPGHVDFSYEVSRSLQACEGAILVVDATQGVQAQTLANLNLARKQNLQIIPVLNKIDLPNVQIAEVTHQLMALGFAEDEILHISAKTGRGVDLVLKNIVNLIPEPKGDSQKPLRALIFSSGYDPHRGVVVDVRVVDGKLPFTPNTSITFMASGAKSTPIELGYFMPQMKASAQLTTGEVGYIATGLKDVSLAKVGDTITQSVIPAQAGIHSIIVAPQAGNILPLPGYKEPKPMVFLGLFPINSDEYPEVRVAIGKLRLSDSAFSYRPISSLALGNGFHCGFLGLLHAEVVQERLSREFNLSLFATAPSVEYLVKFKYNAPIPPLSMRGLEGVVNNDYISIQSAAEFPDPSFIEAIKEPLMQLSIFSPKRYVGDIMQLSQDKRAEFVDLEYIGTEEHTESDDHALAKFTYIIPLSEMIIDFFDQLKSVTQGYASLDYDFFDYAQVDVIKMDILVNHEKVDAFAQLVVSDRAPFLGRRMVEKLAEVIPRRQFNIPIQAAIGGQIIARADVKPFRKDVLQKLYGGDRTRKDKLLEKQKKGKARMKMVGQIEIPQSAFLQVFRKS